VFLDGAAPIMPALDRLITWPELETLVPYGRQHILRLERDGKFPLRIQLGPGRVAWRLSEVEEWLASRARGPAPRFAHLEPKPRHPEPSTEDIEALRRMAHALGFDLVMPEPERREAGSGP
jgi:prophage regulatory protein